MTEALAFREALSVEVSEASAQAGIDAFRQARESGLAPVFAYNAAAAAMFGARYTEAPLPARNGLLVEVINALSSSGVFDLLRDGRVPSEKKGRRG